MYKYFEPLSDTEVEELVELSKNVRYTIAEGHRVRRGVNAPDVMSQYSYSRWFDWDRHQRKQFRDYFPTSVRDRILQGWILKLEPHTGFLDLIDYWADKPNTGKVVTTALQDQSIWLDGQEVRLTKGQQIGWTLESLHEIKPCSTGGLWACVMFLGDYSEESD